MPYLALPGNKLIQKREKVAQKMIYFDPYPPVGIPLISHLLIR